MCVWRMTQNGIAVSEDFDDCFSIYVFRCSDQQYRTLARVQDLGMI
jgi:hypothetical protein